MKFSAKPAIAAGICFLSLSLGHAAQAQDRNVQIQEKLFSKIADAFSIGKAGPDSGQNYLVLMNPGKAISANLDPKDVDDNFLISLQMDVLPGANWIFQERSDTVSSVYDFILQNKLTANIELTADQQKRLEDARAILETPVADAPGVFGPSDALKRYRKYKGKYVDAFDALEDARVDAEIAKKSGTPKGVPTSMVNALHDAKDDFETLGQRAKIESALETVRELSGNNPAITFDRARKQRDAFQRRNSGGNPYPDTITVPPYNEWRNDDGWTKITFTEKDVQNQSNSSTINTQIGVSIPYHLWKFGASSKYNRQTENMKSDVKDMSISFEAKRVTIYRPWMDAFLLRQSTWMLGPTASGKLISDGQPLTRNSAPTGMMPLLPTGVLLARNIKISGQWGSEEKRKFSEQLDVDASVSFGPFQLGGGSISKGNKNEYSRAQLSGNAIEAEGIQILGYFCDVLPKTPNPDPKLTFTQPVTAAEAK